MRPAFSRETTDVYWPNSRVEYVSMTPLQVATTASTPSLAVVNALLDAGARVDALPSISEGHVTYPKTPLTGACFDNPQPAIVDRLLRAGADARETKGLCFDLQRADFEQLCAGDCHYCGRGATHIHRNGVDCVDDDKGYAINNCVTCCGQCNQSKREMPAHEFIAKAIAVASRDICVPDMPRCLTVICKRCTRRIFGRSNRNVQKYVCNTQKECDGIWCDVV